MRFWSSCIQDLYNEAGVSVGNDTNLFAMHNLRMYSLHKDQSCFGPIRQLPQSNLFVIGLFNHEVTDHIEATNDIAPYRSTLPSPIVRTNKLVTANKSKQLNTVAKKRSTPAKNEKRVLRNQMSPSHKTSSRNES